MERFIDGCVCILCVFVGFGVCWCIHIVTSFPSVLIFSQSRCDPMFPPDTGNTANSTTQSQAKRTFVKPTQTKIVAKRRMFVKSPPVHSSQC